MMHGLGTGAVVHAVPQPLSPFNWKIIVSHGEAYDVASVNLWDAERRRPAEPAHAAEGILGAWGRIAAGYQPVSTANWVRYSRFGETASQNALARDAWNQEVFTRFRQFAKFPIPDKIERDGTAVCVSFFDLRFTVPTLPTSLAFGLCRDSIGASWRVQP